MNWLKHVWIDLIVTVLIVIATTWELKWAVWAVLIYTPILLILKLLPLSGGLVQRQLQSRQEGGAPTWFYHVIYAVNVGFLLAAAWWYTGAAWLGIWLLSWLARQRNPETS